MSKSVPLVRARWGRPRSPSALVRISLNSRAILDRLPDKDRRPWLDRLIRVASRTPEYHRLIGRVGGSIGKPCRRCVADTE